MKTLQEIIDSIILYINNTYKGIKRIDLRIGTVLRDIIITPLAYAIYNVYTYIEGVVNRQNIFTVSGDQLDEVAANWGFTRSKAVPSSGVVRFYRSTPPVTEFEIPIGTMVYSDNLSFKVINSVTFPLNPLVEDSVESPYKDFYYVEAFVVCETPGAVGNVGVGEIRRSSLPSVNSVDNPYAFSNGKDEQDDDSLRSYVIGSASGGYGTEGGYHALVLKNYSIKDAQVISYNSADAFNNSVNGTGNIFIYSLNNISKTEKHIGLRNIIPYMRPLISVSSVKKNGTLLQPSDYTVTLDRTSLYRGSTMENSSISISNSIVISPTDEIEITYIYNEDVPNIQSFIELPENKIIGSELYVKMAMPVKIKIQFDLNPLLGYDLIVVGGNVKTAINEYFSSLSLGASVQKSDVINVIYNVDGVDSVDLGSFIFEKADDYYASTYSQVIDLTIKKSEYYVVDSITIN